MNLDAITQFILTTIVPLVSAIGTVAVTCAITIGKVKKELKNSDERAEERSRENRELKRQLLLVAKENINLKNQMAKINAKLDNVKFVKKEK